MERYDRITSFENARRCNHLALFLNDLDQYFSHTMFGRLSDEPDEDVEAVEARARLNRSIPEVDAIIWGTGISPVLSWSPPPAIGGRVLNINMVTELFRLHRFQISPSELVDVVQRAIGVYQADRRNSIYRTANPFFWIGRLISAVATVPFAFLGSLGFNRDKIEGSRLGRIVKGLFELLTAVASVLTVLQLTDTLGSVLRFLHLK